MQKTYSQSRLAKGVRLDLWRVDKSYSWQMGEKPKTSMTIHGRNTSVPNSASRVGTGLSTRCARSGFRLRAQTPAKRLKLSTSGTTILSPLSVNSIGAGARKCDKGVASGQLPVTGIFECPRPVQSQRKVPTHRVYGRRDATCPIMRYLLRNHPDRLQPCFDQLRPCGHRKLRTPKSKPMATLRIQMHFHRNARFLQCNIV
jgi:hypothetical protein